MSRSIFPVLGLSLALLALAGCVSRASVKPRSEVISEALSAGLVVPSIEEDRAKFFRIEEIQRKRLIALLKKRAQMGSRDINYRIGPADELEINVFDVPELNLTARVSQGGYLALPLIGAVKAGGLTEDGLKEELRRRLSAYVRSPQVSTFITAYASQRVAVMGAVRNPANYSLNKGMNTLLEVLSAAGGVTEKAGNFLTLIPVELSGLGQSSDVDSRAKLAMAASAPAEWTQSGIEIYLDQVLGTSGGVPIDLPIRGGDMVIVPEGGKIMVDGEVQKPGSYDLGQQMSILGALAAAGGITYSAKADEIEILRDTGDRERVRLVLDLQKIATGEERDVRVKNGDIVKVPTHSGRKLTQDTFDGLSRIINFGVGGTVNVVK